jgi:hypothetical protein
MSNGTNSGANPNGNVGQAGAPCPLSQKSSDKIAKKPTQTLKVSCEHGRKASLESVEEFGRIKEFHVVPWDDGADKVKYEDEVTVEWVDGEDPKDPVINGLTKEGSGKKHTYKVVIDKPTIAAEEGWSKLSDSNFIFNPVERLAELFRAMKAPFRDKRVFHIPGFSPGHSIHIHNPDKWELYIIGNFLPEPKHITFGYSLDHKDGGQAQGSAETEMTSEHVKNDGGLEWKTDNDGQVLGQTSYTPGPPDPSKPKLELYGGHIGEMKEPNQWVTVFRNGKQIKVPLLSTLTGIYNLVNGLYSAVKFVSQGSPNWWYFTGSIRVLKGKIGVGWQNMEIEAPEHRHMAAFVFDMAYEMELFYAKIEFGIGPDLVLFKAQIYVSIDGGLDIKAGLRDALYFDGKTNSISIFAGFNGHIEGELGARFEVKFLFKLEPKMLTGLNMPGEIGIKKGLWSITGDLEFTGIKAQVEFSFGLHMAIKRLATALGFSESTENTGLSELKKQLIIEFRRPPVGYQEDNENPIRFCKGQHQPTETDLKNRRLCGNLSSLNQALSRMLKGECFDTSRDVWKLKRENEIEFYRFESSPDHWEYKERDCLPRDEVVAKLIDLIDSKEARELSSEQYAKFASSLSEHLHVKGLREARHKKRDLLLGSYLDTIGLKMFINAEYEKHCKPLTDHLLEHDQIADLFIEDFNSFLTEAKRQNHEHEIILSEKNCKDMALQIGKKLTAEVADNKSKPRVVKRQKWKPIGEGVDDKGAIIEYHSIYSKFLTRRLSEEDKAKDSRYSAYFGDYRKETGWKKAGCFLVGGEYKNDWTIMRGKKLSSYRWPNLYFDDDSGEADDDGQEEWEYNLKKVLVKKLSRNQEFLVKFKYIKPEDYSLIGPEDVLQGKKRLYFFKKGDENEPSDNDIANREESLSATSLVDGLKAMIGGEGFEYKKGKLKHSKTRKPFEFYPSLKFTSKTTNYIPHMENGRPVLGLQVRNRIFKHIPEKQGLTPEQVVGKLINGKTFESLPSERHAKILLEFRDYLESELIKTHPKIEDPKDVNYKTAFGVYYIKVSYFMEEKAYNGGSQVVYENWSEMLYKFYQAEKKRYEEDKMKLLTNAKVAGEIINKLKEVENAYDDAKLLRSNYEYNDFTQSILDQIMPENGEPLFKERLSIGAITEVSDLLRRIDRTLVLRHSGRLRTDLHKVIVDMLENAKAEPEPGGNWRKRYFANYILFEKKEKKNNEPVDPKLKKNRKEMDAKDFADILLRKIGSKLEIDGVSDAKLDNTYEGFEGIAYAIRYEILEKIRYSGEKNEETVKTWFYKAKPIKRATINIYIDKEELEKYESTLMHIFKESNNAYESFIEEIQEEVEHPVVL